ncbi:CopD family protein [Billgrantia lactosivorans]|uniref:CopD family protein n=1 Tax=Billgrantia lactosivorans TaxID=2185141 RepID=UPI000DAD4267|nr:CopD family protein [Halomonas lactosivorans]
MSGVAWIDPDPWVLVRVLVQAGFYASALLAVGSVMFRVAFPALAPRDSVVLHRCTWLAAGGGIAMLLLLWLLQAAYLGGGSWRSAFDPMLLGIVADSAQGERMRLAVVGLLVLPLATRGGAPAVVRYLAGALGLGLVLAGFAQVGHTRGDIGQCLLLIAHLAMAAFWLAALPSLYRALRRESPHGSPTSQLQRFSRLGAGMIALLLTTGGALAVWLLGGSVASPWQSAYGQVLTLKLVLVGALLGLGACNRWWLVPALARGEHQARHRLRLSIAGETVLMALILLAAACLMNTSAPAG